MIDSFLELASVANVFDNDLGCQKDPVEQPITSNILWVLQTCLIAGVLPFKIILMATSSPSMMRNWDSHWADCVVGKKNQHQTIINLLLTLWVLVLECEVATVSWMLVCLGCTVLLFERKTSITMSPTSRASKPNSSIQRNVSDSLDLCETQVCFSHIQLTSTRIDFQNYTRLLMRLISSPQSRQQNLGLVKIQVYNAVPCFPHDNTVGNRLSVECKEINLACRVTCLSQFCHLSCNFVDQPWNLKSSNSCQQAFQGEL